MSVSDIQFTNANGWLYSQEDSYSWSITPRTGDSCASSGVCSVNDSFGTFFNKDPNYVWPSVYLKANIQIIEGNGGSEPYKLK